ncbi:hypothetical protein RND71_006074 [Anisodus tanguticus]|uniref:Uncharacterized protein n=1 Tax=Anisodus tanguticus TaxID=243964 RepID=A0AAE1VNA2_9SOLA|nr:hypothetical protein RND71_006074 [Anisodus tanguticus]
MSNSYRFGPISSKANSSNLIQHQVDIADSRASLAMNFQEFGGAFDPIDILSSWNISQRQQAATKLAVDSIATKSRMSYSYNFPPQNSHMSNYLCNNSQFGVCGLMADFGSNGLISKSRTPDCLLSTTDTSIEDVIFSDDSKILCTYNNAVSSGESAVDAHYNNNIQCPVNELDETVSRASSYHPHNNQIRSSEVKRSHDQALVESGNDLSRSGIQASELYHRSGGEEAEEEERKNITRSTDNCSETKEGKDKRKNKSIAKAGTRR